MKKKQLESVENHKKEMDELMTIVKMCVQKCDSYDNPKVKLKEGVNKTNLKQLELQFVAIDKNANECGLTSDAKTSFRQKLASKQKEAKHKINLEATQFMEDLVKLETSQKDSQGKKIETKGEETTRLLRNKEKKTVLDKLKAHEKESKLNGKAANLKKFYIQREFTHSLGVDIVAVLVTA